MTPHRSKEGFTILELAIVIGIIALLAGGILVGQSVIRRSELVSVMTDVKKLTAATKQFRDKYQYLPGDFPKAEDYWGSDSACPNTPTNTVPKKETCNGDGDGIAGNYAGPHYERWRAIQQLANEGLILGQYTGVVGAAGGTDSIPGMNIPKSKIQNAGFTMMWLPVLSGNLAFFDGDYGHIIIFGGYISGAANLAGVITPPDASSIDQKMDDGLPAYGAVRGLKSAAPNCSTTAVSSTAVYATDDTSKACSLVFNMGF